LLFKFCRLPLPASRSCLLLTPPCRSAWLSSGAAALHNEQQQHASWQTYEQPAAAAAALAMLLLLLLLVQRGWATPVVAVLLGCRCSVVSRYRASLKDMAAVKQSLQVSS
jgi:hypothetical protein